MVQEQFVMITLNNNRLVITAAKIKCHEFKLIIIDFFAKILELENAYQIILEYGEPRLKILFLDSLTPNQKDHFHACQYCLNFFKNFFNIVDEMAVFNDFND